jgi:uncharacterized protein (DUF302 family)
MGTWFTLYNPNPTTPQMTAYIIGNPIIAQTMMVHDYLASLHVPIRILIMEDTPASKGCSVTWDLPSSLIAISALSDLNQEAKLKSAAQALDEKAETFIRYFTDTA